MNLFKWLRGAQKEAENVGQLIVPEDYTIGVDPFKEVENEEAKPKMKIKAILSNKVLTVFLPGGDAVVNTDASKEMFLAVQSAKDEDEVRSIMLSIEAAEAIKDIGLEEKKKDRKVKVDRAILEDKDVKNALPELLDTQEFRQNAGSLYLKGIDVPIPTLLAKELLKAGKNDTSEYYDSLKSFWCWCVINPDPIAREDLFGFLERGDFKITKNGFFTGFRNVIRVKEGKESKDATLTSFISDKYVNIKTKQKKSPKNFDVYSDKDGGYIILLKGKVFPEGVDIEDIIGNLADLYNGLSDLEDNEYTDQYTKKMIIKIGSPVKMEREKCDNDPFSECSKGLHVGNKKFGYQSFGNTTILVAVNPMNVVAVPHGDANKMRVCEYMPLAVLEGSKSNWLEDADTLAIEEEYAVGEIQNLLELAGTAGKKEAAIKKAMGGEGLVSQVAEKLEDLQNAIAQRVVKVK